MNGRGVGERGTAKYRLDATGGPSPYQSYVLMCMYEPTIRVKLDMAGMKRDRKSENALAVPI